MRGFAFNNTTALINYCRMMIIWDRQPNKALPAITDVLNSINSISFNNDQNKKRFKTLKNEEFTLVGNSATAGQNNDTTICAKDFYLKFKKPLRIQFGSAGTGAIGDITSGSLLLVTVGGGAAGTAAATLTAGFRTRYID